MLYYGRRGDLASQAAEAVIGEWNEITDWWQASPYRAQVCDALQMLKAG